MTLRVTPQEIVERAEASGKPGLLAKDDRWSRIRLGDIARVVNGAPFRSALFNVDCIGIPLVRIRDVGAARPSTWYDGPYEELHRVERGDILVGMDGDFRVARWRSSEGLLNQRVCRLDVDEERYDAHFLVLALQGYLDAIWAATSSTTVKHLSSRTIADIPLPYPDMDEQRRIVDLLEDHLSRLDAAVSTISNSRARLSSLEERFVVAELLGESMGGERELRTLGSVGTDDGELAKLPFGWSWQRLSDVAEVVGGVTKDAKRQSDPGFVEVPYLRVANVQRGRLDLRTVTTIRVPAGKAEALRLRLGDVLMNEGGDRDKLARGWVWDGQVEQCIHQNHVFRARVVDGAIEPKLLSWIANTIGGRWAERNGKQSVNLASISLTKIRQMPVPVPPKDVQAGMVKQLEDLLEASGRLASSLQEATLRAAGLRRALLTAAFSGRLTGASSDMDLVEEMAGV